jgi:hypothetical protein
MLSSPLRLPLTEGANVTEIGQEPPTAIVRPQSLVSKKSPEYEICAIVTGTAPLLLNVTI